MAAQGGTGPEQGTLVGRDQELAILADVLDSTRAGRLEIVLVEGEDGIGKSALAAAFAARARAQGVRVMTGACLDLDTEIPYLPFSEGLRGLLGGMADVDRAALLGPAAEIVEPILHPGVPEPVAPTPVGPVGPGGQGGTIDMARLELFESLLRLAQRLASRGPLLVVLEDVQWLDHSSADLLAFLARNLRGSPLMVMLTARPGGAGGAEVGALAAALDRHLRVERIELGPLAAAALAELLAVQAGPGRAPDAAETREIARRSGGNPLFALELLAWARRSSAGARSGASAGSSAAGAGTGGTSATPPRLRDMVAARLADLPHDARGILRLASAGGRLVDDDLLAAATGLPAAQVSAGIRAAVAEGLLVPAGSPGREGYAFRHDLVREAVHAELLPGERARLHEAYAQALSAGAGQGRARHVDHGELAYHWDAAGALDRAYAAHIDAAEAAQRIFAFDAAHRHFERALELWPEVPDADDLSTLDRVDLRHAAAQAAALAGDHERAIELERDLLGELGTRAADDERAMPAREVLRRSLWENGQVREGLAEAERALALVGAEAGRPRASALAHLAGLLLLTGDVRRARALATEGVEVAMAAGCREEAALSGGIVGWSLVYAGRLDEGLAWIRRGWDAAVVLGEPRGRALADDNLARALELAGLREEGVQLAVAGAADARRRGLGRTYGALLAADAARLLRAAGRGAEAWAEVDAGLAAEPVGPGQAALVAAAAQLAIDEDRLDEAASMVAGAMSAGDTDAVGWLVAARAQIEIRRGDPAAALATLRSATNVGAHVERGEGAGTTDGADAAEGAADAAAEAATDADRTGASLVVLGASIGPLLALAGRAAADRTLQLRATGAGPDAGLIADRRRIDALVAWLHRRAELAAALAPYLAIAAAELARAADPAAAADAWRVARAAALAGPNPLPGAAAYACLRLAESMVVALGGRDPRDEAAAAVRQGLGLASAAGLTALEGDLRLLARRARLPLDGGPASASASGVSSTSSPDIGNPFGLTDREVEVLRLVAAGCTNREIGEQLFMSPKTASVHVSAILGKLGVPGRLDAALVAQQVGLVGPATQTRD